MISKKVKYLVVKSICTVLIIGTLVLSGGLVRTNSVDVIEKETNEGILICTPEDKIGGGII